MADDVMPEEFMTVVLGESERSPAEVPANALALTLEVGSVPGSRPLTLHGFFNLGVDMTGRYDAPFPNPIHVVAILRRTGHVHVQNLTNQDDIPAQYVGVSAPPAITRKGPDGRPSSAGITESGFFNVDLTAHLGLAGKPGVYDVFLWIEDILSDMPSAEKPKEKNGVIGATLFKRPPGIAEIEQLPDGGELTLSTEHREKELWFVGQSDKAPVSVIAYVLQSQEPVWTVLGNDKEDDGDKEEKASADEMEASVLSFAFKALDLLPGIGPGDRVLAVAVSGGRRTPLLDVTISR